MSSLPKPVLRGHVQRYGIKLLISALSVAVLSGSAYHFLCGVPRRRGYVEFLKTYDPIAHEKDLISWGYLKTPFTMKQKIKEAMESETQ